jgi:hypothetical protein
MFLLILLISLQAMHYKLPKEVLEGILQYLYTRPYSEVKDGVKILENLEPLKDSE